MNTDLRKQSDLLSLYARRAAAASAEKSGMAISGFKTRADGSPIPENGCHWSVSHKKTGVAGIAAPFRTGIDIEQVGPVREGLFARITDQEERALVGDATPMAFFRLWTAKEAVIKAAGGRYPDIFRCRIIRIIDGENLEVLYRENRWQVAQGYFGPHVVSVVSEGMDVSWSLEHMIGGAVESE